MRAARVKREIIYEPKARQIGQNGKLGIYLFCSICMIVLLGFAMKMPPMYLLDDSE